VPVGLSEAPGVRRGLGGRSAVISASSIVSSANGRGWISFWLHRSLCRARAPEPHRRLSSVRPARGRDRGGSARRR
jgi:hypothetical protein